MQTNKMSTNKKMALGKGIASLLKTNSTDYLINNSDNAPQRESSSSSVGGTSMMVDINKVVAGEYQPRKIFKEKNLQELTSSIKENGIIQPLIVIEKGTQLELIAGERRLRAAKLAGLTQVPVVIKRATDRERLVMSVIENVQRSDLNCVEEALAYYQLMDSFNLTQEEVAKKIGKERSTIANFLRVLKLPRDVIALLQKEVLSFGHAKVLAVEKDHEQVIRLANAAIADNLSVRELEDLVGKQGRNVKRKSESTNTFLDEKMDQFKESLEKRTGFHFKLSAKKNGSGNIVIKFNNEAEFNDIYEYLLKR